MTVTVLCLGQSQMAGWFVFGSAPNRGADAFQSQLAGLLGVSPSTVVMLNGAVGGTAADRQAAVDPTNATLDIEAGHGLWWWDLEADSGAGAPGPIMTRAEGIADDSGLTIDLILWAQGHQDAAGHYYPPAGASPAPMPDRFETATRAIFARLRSLYGANVPIVIQELDTPWDLGPPPSYVLYAPQIAVLRQRQLDIVLDTDDTYFGASTTQYGLASYRQESFGYLHFTDETYRLVAQAMARSAAGILGSPADLVTDPTVTARLRLPYLAEAMLNADVAVNEGLDILDSRVGTAVFADQLTSPPAGPAVGDLYLVPASPTGAWAGQADRVARWDGGAWLFYPPEAGWRLYVVASDAFRYWDGDQWLTEQIGTASASGVTNDSGVTGDSVADALDALDAAKADSAGLATIATSGDYGDLSGVPALQPLDADLTAIAALAPADRGLLQYRSGAWTARTRRQVAADLRRYKAPNVVWRNQVTGATWIASTPAVPSQAVCWAPELGVLMAVGASSFRGQSSPDGITWTARSAVASNTWTAVCWSPELGLFAAVASSGTGNRVMTADASLVWTARTSAADNTWTAVCWSPELGLFAAVASSGSGNRVMTSPDGITWTLRVSADNDWTGICWAAEPGLFVAVAATGTGNRVMTSPDGIAWTTRPSAADNSWTAVCWSPELSLFAAVANSGSGNRVMTSPDGVTWTARAAVADADWRSVCWAPELGLFAAVAANNTVIQTSPDGVTWTSRAAAQNNVWRSVCWSPELGLFVSVADGGSGGTYVQTSRSAYSYPWRSA